MLFARLFVFGAALCLPAYLVEAVSDGVLVEKPNTTPSELTPECALHCWDNTKYVTACVVPDEKCLCAEEVYGKALHQCLHSQCDSTKFSLAINQITWRCSSTGTPVHFGITPKNNREELRRRELSLIAGGIVFGSASADGYPAGSVTLPTASAYAIQSSGYATNSAGGTFTTGTAFSAVISLGRLSEGIASVTNTPVVVADMVLASTMPQSPREQFQGVAMRSRVGCLMYGTGFAWSVWWMF